MGQLVPVFGMVTGVLITGLFFWGVVQMARSHIGEAIARRIQGRHGSSDPDLVEAISSLREQLEHLQQQVAESNERLDFTERLLTRGRDAPSPE